MAACRNGGLTVAASIPRVTCVARSSLPYHTFLIVSFRQPITVMCGEAFTPLSYIFNLSFGRL